MDRLPLTMQENDRGRRKGAGKGAARVTTDAPYPPGCKIRNIPMEGVLIRSSSSP